MPQAPEKISKEVFKKTLSGNKNYLPQKVSRELKAAKMSHLLYRQGVSKAQAIKAIKHLQEKGTVSKFKSPSQLWQKADSSQRQMDQTAQAVEREKHVQANIAIDITEELAREESGKAKTNYNPKSALGRYLVDEIKDEAGKRQQQADDELEKRKQMFSRKLPSQKKPPMANSDKLKDLDID
ncbi:MAG: hypothetical protein A2729_01885 [Candidatus Buchananbacteria bacterium RIFCSPHIGHO2_01_FULL_39_14]|uniref:Uncharacterized protein n=2 Tax=Candidatus Buchananiibacteriota TaxID=1817903 RepID=A0A1G1YVU9_9BACT|nr:MAG: hypothetical protein A2729_01885 [Candidatus Buchananbacteria bacterium RIFCSPHIGHO2_01_FULL_39_14]OGY49402.1 MAG: hypothetical protein A3D39_01830 [Candidatus Buchananbacteria bacterium RIFCSPHIGHO2_02_FULL_39_17]OGY55700.1 MAG: hypothetical protein A2912_00890 [Candidatus Buchananbacteria bacterium RIFCSPLOWO2_01_FULL_40_23b]